MHIWGGILLVASWYEIERLGVFKSLINKNWFHPLLFLVAIILIWEVFKYLIANVVSQNYVLDTVMDLSSGLIGGLITFYWFKYSKVK